MASSAKNADNELPFLTPDEEVANETFPNFQEKENQNEPSLTCKEIGSGEEIKLADESESDNEGRDDKISNFANTLQVKTSDSDNSENFVDACMDLDAVVFSVETERVEESIISTTSTPATSESSTCEEAVSNLSAAIANTDEVNESFETPDVETKDFVDHNNLNNEEKIKVQTSIGKEPVQQIDEVVPVETGNDGTKISITSEQTREQIGDLNVISDETVEEKAGNCGSDEVNVANNGQSSTPIASNIDNGICTVKEKVVEPEPSLQSSEESSHEPETGSPPSPKSDNSNRQRNGSSFPINEPGDVFNPGEEIIDYLVDVNDDAEARLAARRQARAEAREIRMKELEKQQKEFDENADRHYDMHTPGSGGSGSGDVVNRAAFRVALGSHRGPSHSVGSASYHSSRRSSEDSSEDGMVSIRDMRHELKELEDKFRKSMVHNAQLDNEKSALTYQVELLKDRIEDLEESLTLLQREYRDKCRDFENLKRLSTQLKDELEYCKAQLLEKEELIKEYGLVVVENEVEVDLGNGEKETRIKRSLVTQETAQVLSSLGSGSLDVRLRKFLEEKNDLLDQIRRLTIDLEEERSRHSKGDRGAQNNSNNSSAYTNGPDEDSIDAQNASKQLADYRFKTQKYEQEIATLQANVARLDGQVTRFKTAAEEAESREDDLKIEKRKLQRELREAQSKLDELETTNSHLQKRLDKLKTAKSTLLKEL